MKKEKQLFLDEIKNEVEKSGSFLIAKYNKLSANKANEFRRELEKSGGSFEVVRKRLFLKAAEKVGIQFSLDFLEGHVGLILGGKDSIEMAKSVIKFSKENEDTISLLGGFIDGQRLQKDDVQRLSTLPGKDQMRAELLALFEAPQAEVLAVVDALLTSVMHCIENKAQQS